MLKGSLQIRVFGVTMPDPFHLRFNVGVPIEETQRRFVNRIGNSVFQVVEGMRITGKVDLSPIMLAVQTFLGEGGRYSIYFASEFIEAWNELVAGQFVRCLQAIEGLYIGLRNNQGFRNELEQGVTLALSLSEFDLGVSWQDGMFIRKGARNLDEALVNEPLHWLSDPKYQNVLSPFKKGLTHFLKGDKNPERRGDTVTDMYEALEALAGILTGRSSNDLASNRELFISKLGLPEPYKIMLKEYIEYGCQLRHALKEVKPRRWPSIQETEAFVYLTGIFIRLAIQPANS